MTYLSGLLMHCILDYHFRFYHDIYEGTKEG